MANTDTTRGVGKAAFLFLLMGAFFCSSTTLRPFEYNFSLADICLSFGAILVMLGRDLALNKVPVFVKIWAVAMLTFTASFFIATIFGNNNLDVLIWSAQYAFSFVLLPYVFSAMSRTQLIWCFRAFAIGVISVILIGLWVYFSYGSVALGYLIAQKEDYRLESLAGNANALARNICFAGLALLVFGLGQSFASKIIKFVGIFICAAGIMMSASISGLGMGVAVLTVYWATYGNFIRKTTFMLCGLIFVLALSQLWLPAIFVERVLNPIESGGQLGSGSERADLFYTALDAVSQSPFFGQGAGWFVNSRVFYGVNAHNTFLLIWAEAGMFAFLAWLTIVAAPLTVLRSKIKNTSSIALVMTGVTLFVLSCLSGNHLYGRNISVPLVLMFLLAAKSITDIPRKRCAESLLLTNVEQNGRVTMR